MAVTLQDIAEDLGLQKSTVSRVLNGKQTRVKVSEKTRVRIFEAVRRLGYHPNAAARSLALRRTGHIGFMLSDKVTDGWGNMLYARNLEGVERACRSRGYGLNISLYNLSNIKSFVFPERIGQRSVDGLILAGHVEEEVLKQFGEFAIPCVCIGDDLAVSRSIPTVASDFIGGVYNAIEYLAQMGHKKILFAHTTTPRGIETSECVARLVEENLYEYSLDFMLFSPPGGFDGDFDNGPTIMDWWISLPEEERPTAILATDQVHISLLKLMAKHGYNCPEDISLLSTCETRYCEFSMPGLTSIHQDFFRLGQEAVDLLTRLIETEAPAGPDDSRNGFPCELIIRESCKNLHDYDVFKK